MASEQFTGKTVQAVERTFDVIRILRRNRSMTVSEVAEELDLPTSTAHLHLKTLESTGYAVNSNGRYHLSLRFLRDGITLRSMEQIYNISAETVDGIARETDEVAAVLREKIGNLDLALLTGFKLSENWNAQMRVVTAVPDPDEQEKAQDFLEKLIDLGRFENAEAVVGPTTFNEFILNAPQADLNIFGLQPEPNFDTIRGWWTRRTQPACSCATRGASRPWRSFASPQTRGDVEGFFMQ
jgi:DNA-binding MarR family transcriptional regulator